MAQRLTDTAIEKLATPKARYEIRDAVVPGLLLRVGVKGDKIWEAIVTRGGKRSRVRLGQFPDIKTKDARKAAEAAKLDARRPSRTTEVSTFSDLWDRYTAARSGSLRSWRMIDGAWTHWGKDRLGHVRLADLTAHHGIDLRDHVSREVSDIRGSQVIRYLRPALAWAADERIIDVNPWHGLKAKAVPQARDRTLKPKEWQAVWDASFGEPHPMGQLARALMLTACRLNNVATMRWDEIDGDVWTIPRDKVKATRPDKAKAHFVPLTDKMLDLLATMPKVGPYVFSMDGSKPVQPGSRQKERLAKRAGVKEWTYHDLRRSGATKMAEAGVSRFIIERVLGHSDGSVTATYDRAEYLDEKRDALERLADTINDDSPENVVKLRG